MSTAAGRRPRHGVAPSTGGNARPVAEQAAVMHLGVVNPGGGQTGLTWLAGGIKELARLSSGGDPAEREMGVSGVAGRSGVTLPVNGVVVPGPGDDRLLLIPGEQVAPALRVAVPQLSPASCAADCPPDEPAD